ncbi:hypothetical protein IFM89_011114 [Coptis chinensis]|uniref:DUF4283 domain-containing protein n=1 Tax=Coptis chinensis TaxID=261450 RepID=A0A835LGU7_9MAGN|nr:hypothetical protein IFM89_011114 [Coptis chinensis]
MATGTSPPSPMHSPPPTFLMEFSVPELSSHISLDHYGFKLSFPYVKSILEKTWKIKGTMDITTDRDVFFIRMSTLEDKQMVLEGGPIFIAGKIFVIRPWSPEAENHRNKATTVPIWAKL